MLLTVFPFMLFTHPLPSLVFFKEEETSWIEKGHLQNFRVAGNILFRDLSGAYLYIYILYTFHY